MMRSLKAISAGASLAIVGHVAHAHHSTALQFDMTREWRNPHSWLHVEVENDAGDPELWRVEFGSANSLYRRGWRRDDLPVGMEVTIHGLPARDDSRQMEGDEVTLADGRSLFEED